jgi:hypothetical protein
MESQELSSEERNVDYYEGDDPEKTGGPRPAKRKYKPRAKKAESWKYFTQFVDEDGKDKAKCMYCNQDICCNSTTNGTSGLKRHLKACGSNPSNLHKKISRN